MIFHLLDQHRWWFVAALSAVTWGATAAIIIAMSTEGSPNFTGDATIAAAAAVATASVYFLMASHISRVLRLFRLRWQIRRRESLLEEVAENLAKCERDSLEWRDAQPVGLELREVLEMATEQERSALQTLTLARSTNAKDLELRVRQLGTPMWEEWMRRFRGVASYRDYDVVVRTVASGMDVATDKGYAPAELEAALLRRIFSGRLGIMAPDERERVLTAWMEFANDHRDSLSSSLPAASPDLETDLAGAGSYAMGTVLAGAVVHERGLTLPTTFFQGVSSMLPPLIGALGWKITSSATVRFMKYFQVRRVLPAIVLLTRMRSGVRVRRVSHLEKLESERNNLKTTTDYVEGQLLELQEQVAHLSHLKFSMRRLRMVLPLA
jgi:uncharacterized protein YaaW (UPF0174 family)